MLKININKLDIKLGIIEKKIPHNGESTFRKVDGVIFGKVDDQWLAYDDTCDHNGGTLCIDQTTQKAVCPNHKWTLDLETGRYENGCVKTPLKASQVDGFIQITKREKLFPEIRKESLSNEKIVFHFNSHASISMNIGGFNLITDPWFIGSCFATGWWHLQPPSVGAVSRLQSADLIYISHNHPDHLHLPTLRKYVSQKQCILVPNFESKSVEKILREEGYNNLIVADFLDDIEIEKNGTRLKLIIVKSGDERDDSSLLAFTSNQSVFFGVDTNMPNDLVLPKVTILFSSFAGGATGFPSRVENFSLEEKKSIIKLNRANIFTGHVKQLINATSPRYVVPYAGYFTEVGRDSDVKEINYKNSSKDFINFINQTFSSIKPIDPLENPHFDIDDGRISINDSNETPLYFIDDEYVENDIKNFSLEEIVVDKNFLLKVGKSFFESSFYHDLIIIIVATDDNFLNILDGYLAINFSKNRRYFKYINIEHTSTDALLKTQLSFSENIEVLYIRQDSLKGVVLRGLPFEDLSIGFQIKMYRQPNIYNFAFWDFFTNHEIVKI